MIALTGYPRREDLPSLAQAHRRTNPRHAATAGAAGMEQQLRIETILPPPQAPSQPAEAAAGPSSADKEVVTRGTTTTAAHEKEEQEKLGPRAKEPHTRKQRARRLHQLKIRLAQVQREDEAVRLRLVAEESRMHDEALHRHRELAARYRKAPRPKRRFTIPYGQLCKRARALREWQRRELEARLEAVRLECQEACFGLLKAHDHETGADPDANSYASSEESEEDSFSVSVGEEEADRKWQEIEAWVQECEP
ncbi:unnamed protein product [Discula destructiva]